MFFDKFDHINHLKLDLFLDIAQLISVVIVTLAAVIIMLIIYRSIIKKLNEIKSLVGGQSGYCKGNHDKDNRSGGSHNPC